MLKGEPILVTGASGFVGSAVLRALPARGATVRVLVRASSPRANLEGLDCEVVDGDMTDAASMAAAMNGVRHLFHVAADYRLWARDPEEIVRNNLERHARGDGGGAGRRRRAHRLHQQRRHLGRRATTAAVVDETAPLRRGEAIGAYKRSKVVAERVVERMVADEGLPAVIVSPSTPIGPRDIKPTPTGRIIVEAATGRMPAFIDTGLNLVHVDDVAEGHLLALEKGRDRRELHPGRPGRQPAARCWPTSPASSGASRRRVSLPRAPLYPLAIAAEAVA